MPYDIPSDEVVVQALVDLGGRPTAAELCNQLVRTGHSRRGSQLAIQRASERGHISVGPDWRLSVVIQAVAA